MSSRNEATAWLWWCSENIGLILIYHILIHMKGPSQEISINRTNFRNLIFQDTENLCYSFEVAWNILVIARVKSHSGQTPVAYWTLPDFQTGNLENLNEKTQRPSRWFSVKSKTMLPTVI